MSTTGILFKKLFRDLRKNWKQFISIIAITLLSVCLVIGFLSSAQSLQERVDEVYTKGNISDLWISTLYEDSALQNLQNNNENYDDYEVIKNIEGIEFIERRTVNTGMYNGTPINSMVVGNLESDNTLNIPYEIEGEKGFLIEKNFASQHQINIGDSFVFEFPNTELVKSIIGPVFDIFLRDGKTNVFKENYIIFNFTITGFMSHPECIDNGSVAMSYFYTNKDTFQNTLEPLIDDTFEFNVNQEQKTQLLELVNSIFTGDNQIVVKVREGADILAVQDRIISYYTRKPDISIPKLAEAIVTNINKQLGTNFNSEQILSYVNELIKENNPDFTGVENIEIPRNYLSCLDVNNITSNRAIMADIKQAQQITFVFPVVFFLVAFLIIITTMRQIIIKEKSQIGVMKALGISNLKILAHYLSFTLILITIGFILGAASGPFIVSFIMNQKYGILFNLPALHFSFPVGIAIVFYLAFILISLLIAFLVCRHEIRKLPIESMRQDSNNKKAKASRKESKLLKTPALTFKMSFRNIFKSKSRSLMVMFGILGCTALLICGMGIDDTLNNGINNDMNYLYDVDITLVFNPLLEAPKLHDEDGFHYEEFTQLNTTLNNSKKSAETQVRLIEDNTQVFPITISESKVAISEQIAKDIDAKVGDVIKFGALNSSFEVEIESIFEAFYFQGIVANKSDFSGTTLGDMVSGGWIKLKGNTTHQEAIDIINTLDTNKSIVSAVSKDELQDTVSEVMGSIKLMTNTVRVFAILLAVVVLINISILNYNERARDIATMKVLGLSRTEIGISLISEIVVLTLVGSLIGCLFGFPLMWGVLFVNRTPLVAFLYTVYPLSYILSVLITLLTSFLINLIMVQRTKKIQMVEALKSYE